MTTPEEILKNPRLASALSRVSEQSVNLVHFFGSRYSNLDEADVALITASVLASLPELLEENPHLYEGMDAAALFYQAQKQEI